MRAYQALQYRDPASGRARWAVLHIASGVWYFPRRYGRSAAERVALRMNESIHRLDKKGE